MNNNPELAAIVAGSKHIYSSEQHNLNDQSAEYAVQTVKHFFDRVIIVQYSVLNTLEDQVLSNVKLAVSEVKNEFNLQLLKVVNLEKNEGIKYGESKTVYAVLSKQHCEHPFPLAKIFQKL